jgi:hypothetical protein
MGKQLILPGVPYDATLHTYDVLSVAGLGVSYHDVDNPVLAPMIYPGITPERKKMAQENTPALQARKAETQLRKIQAQRQKRQTAHAYQLSKELEQLDAKEEELIASLAPEVAAMLRAGKIIT